MILERKCSKDLANFFRRLEKDIHKIIEDYWDSELGLFHLNKISDLITLRKQEYYDILFKYCKIQYNRSRSRTKRLFNLQLKQMSIKSDISITTLSSLFKPDPAIKYNLNNKIFVASEHTLNRVDKLVMNNLSESYKEGLGIEEAKNRLTVRYNGLKGWEAQRIARTEINSAQNDACFDMYGELGCEYQQWWTAQDERVRNGSKGSADHVSLHGKIVKVGTRYSNGLLYPGDRQGRIKEWINCRCTSIPYIIPLGKMAPMGMSEFTEDDLIDIPNWNTPNINNLINTPQKIAKNSINQEEFKRDAKRLVELELRSNHAKSYEESQLMIEEFDQITSKFIKNNLNENDFYDYEDISKKLYKLKTKLKYAEDSSKYALMDDIDVLEDLLDYNGKYYEDYISKEMEKSLEKEVLKDMDLEWYENNFLKQFGNKFKETSKLEFIEKEYPNEVNDIVSNLIGENKDKLLSLDERKTYAKLKNLLEKRRKQYPNKSNEELLGSFYNKFKELDDVVKNPDFIVNINSDYDLPKVAGRFYKGFVKENYRVVKFKKYDFEFLIGDGCDVPTNELIKVLDNIPDSLLNRSNRRVLISSSKEVFSIQHNQYIGGLCKDKDIIVIMGDKFNSKELMRVLPHEAGHGLDYSLGRVSILNREYYNIAKSEGGFVSSYAEKGYKKFGSFYSEDFAEAMREYVNNPTRLKNKFPKRYKYIDDLFKKQKINSIDITESQNKKIGTKIIEEIIEEGKVSKRTKSKLTHHNKYSLSDEEDKLYKSLVKFKREKGDVPSLIDNTLEELENKMELNDLHNLKIEGKLSKSQERRYHYLYDDVVPSLGNQYPNAKDVPKYIFSKEDYLLEKQLNLKRTLKLNFDVGDYTPEDNEKLLEILSKKQFKSLTSYIDGGGKLNFNASKSYVNIFNKYKTKWKIPKSKLDLKKLTIESPKETPMSKSLLRSWNGEINNKYFSVEEEDLIKDLQLKRLMKGKLSNNDSDRLEYLIDKRNFNFLYNWKTNEGSLPYEENKTLKKLYKKFKNDLDIDSSILENNLKPINSKMELEEIKDSKSIIKLKGTTPDGRLPDGYEVEDLFTHSYDDFIASHRAAIQDWANTGNYKRYRKFVVDYDSDVDDYFDEFLEEIDPNMEISEEKAYNILKQLEHNTKMLEDVCNNQTKKPIMLYRYQNNPHLGEGKVGDIVTLKGFNSTAVSKEGAQYYVEKSSSKTLEGKWLLEIEAPAGTKGAYIPSQSIDKFRPEMEFLLQKNTNVKILKYDESKRYAKLRIVKNKPKSTSIIPKNEVKEVKEVVEEKTINKLNNDELLEVVGEVKKLNEELQSISKKVDEKMAKGIFDSKGMDKYMKLSKELNNLLKIFEDQGLDIKDFL